MKQEIIIVGLAQIAPVWLNRQKTLDKMVRYIEEGGEKQCDLIAFGETLLPGYPFWVALTDGACFNDLVQKEMFAYYSQQAIEIESGHLDPVCTVCAKHQIATYLGIVEKAKDRGGHSVYCSLVYIDAQGVIQSVHRKLMPTYEERLVWAIGDGHGLRAHQLGSFTLGGLNCWENWMPQARTALYGMGEDVHVAVWPGSVRNTKDITRFIAMESRSYVVSVSGLMRRTDINQDIPYATQIIENCNETIADGGSCVAGPDGAWLLEPQAKIEGLFTVKLDHQRIREERHNFDIAGHYARPDVLKLNVNYERQNIIGTSSNIQRPM